MTELSRRHRRPKKRKPRDPRIWAVVALPPKDGHTKVWGPLTHRGALSRGVTELRTGAFVRMVEYERVRALAEVLS